MKVLDLFSGIGGFSLGLERAGMETIAFCEFEEYPKSILKKHWPDVPIYDDVRTLDATKYRGAVDVVCGGFPCQPFSVAGKQRGKDDDRHLWPEMLRIIKECKPTWVIGENVAGFITMALDDVLLDLENEGYETQSFVIPACAVGGIHRRDRVWIVAYSKHNGALAAKKRRSATTSISNNKKGANQACELKEVCISSDVADASSSRQSSKGPHGESCNTATSGKRKASNAFDGGDGLIGIPTESTVRNRNDGLPDNVARLKALGNAVVPQIPEAIARAIMAAEAS